MGFAHAIETNILDQDTTFDVFFDLVRRFRASE